MVADGWWVAAGKDFWRLLAELVVWWRANCHALASAPTSRSHLGSRPSASNARSLIAAAAVDKLGLSRRQTGEILNISATAVTKAAQRGRRLLRDPCNRGGVSLLPFQSSKG